ncbi:MAG: hypothetical protein ACR5KW_00570 [Wolbachia sp.]
MKFKNILRDSRSNVDRLKKSSKMAVAIEEITDSKLLEKFNYDYPIKEINIIYISEEATNYLFSLIDSSNCMI